MALDAIEAELLTIEQGVRFLQDEILHTLFAPLEMIPGVGDIIHWLETALDSQLNGLETIAVEIQAQIAQGIENLLPDAVVLLSTAVGDIRDGIANIIDNVATTEDVVRGTINILRQYDANLATWIYDRIAQGFGNTALAILQTLEIEHPEAIDPLLDRILATPDLPDWLHGMISTLRGRHAPWMALVLPILLALAIIPVGEAILHPVITLVRQGSNESFPTEALGPPDATEARIRGVIGDDLYFAEMAKHGLDRDRASNILRTRFERLQPVDAARLHIRGQMPQADYETEMSERGIDTYRAGLISEASRPLLSEIEIRDSYLRGAIPEEKHDALLAQHGYVGDAIATKKRLYNLIPGPADLIHMAIRNTFTPEIVKRFDLFSDFPPEFKDYAAQTGINEFWAQHYWGAHWIVPSNQEGFAAYHRTVDKSTDPNADTLTLLDGTQVQNVIGFETLQLLLREKDTAPFWRDKMTTIAYNPLTRIDIRRMHSVGALTPAQVERAYLDLGYSPANALRLANFTVKLNDREHKDRSMPILDRMRTHLLDLYTSDRMAFSDVAFALTDLGFTDEEAKAYVAEADLVRTMEEGRELESGIGRLYVSNLIPEVEARNELVAASVPPSAIDTLIAKWNLEIAYRGGSAEIHKQRDLTKGEIITAYNDGMISEADATTLLEKLGYDANETATLIGIANFNQAKAARTAQIGAQKALYIAGSQDQMTTSNALDALHVSTAQRDALLAEWGLARDSRVTLIPLATLRDMVINSFMGSDEAHTQLARHRFSAADADEMIRFWQLRIKQVPGGTSG